MSNVAALLLSALATILMDQASKALVVRGPAEALIYSNLGSTGLRRKLNTRPGFLPLSRRAATMIWISALGCVVIAVAIAPWLPMMIVVALGLVLGGASSNLGDRMIRGAVVDFIGVLGWRTFNLADAAMVIGTAMIGWSFL